MTVGVVACGALALHVRAIARRRGLDLDVHALPPQLHNRPERIAPAVSEKLAELAGRARARRGRLRRLRQLRRPRRRARRHRRSSAWRGDTCYDLFGFDEVHEALAEEPGTYFLTDFLARTFEHTVWRSLGLDRYPELRDDYFHSYRRCVWLAQRPTPSLRRAAEHAAGLLGLPLMRARRRRGRTGTRAGAHLHRTGGMKERADVVVIGAGIVGCAAAHYLTLAGVRNVVVLDQGPIGDTGGSSFHAPGLCFQTNGSKLSCTLAQWSARPLPRARHARAAHVVGGRLARGGHHARAPGRGPAPPRLRDLVGPREPRDHARRGGAPRPAARPRAACTAPSTCRATASCKGANICQALQERRRGARRDLHRLDARDRHRHARRAGARRRDRAGRDRDVDGARLPGPVGARVHARARPAAGRDAADAAPLRVDRTRCPSWPAPRSRSSTRSCATRIARCTSASAARATASAPTATIR